MYPEGTADGTGSDAVWANESSDVIETSEWLKADLTELFCEPTAVCKRLLKVRDRLYLFFGQKCRVRARTVPKRLLCQTGLDICCVIVTLMDEGPW